MKILVDSLPYDRSSCPFADSCPCRSNEDKCPAYWKLKKIFSVDNPHQCERFIEYREFMELRNENN